LGARLSLAEKLADKENLGASDFLVCWRALLDLALMPMAE
jgi:hypothetical protein